MIYLTTALGPASVAHWPLFLLSRWETGFDHKRFDHKRRLFDRQRARHIDQFDQLGGEPARLARGPPESIGGQISARVVKSGQEWPNQAR